jgi:hypothetical protein
MIQKLTKLEKIYLRRDTMKSQRLTYESQWKDAASNILPDRLCMQLSDWNKGDRRNQAIYDSTASACVRTAEAGMMSGITSPAKRWFRFLPSSPRLIESEKVREWCDEVADLIFGVIERSNCYGTLPGFYGDMIVFGTSLVSLERHPTRVLQMEQLPLGTFWLSVNPENEVEGVYVEFRMTVLQCYEFFGEDAHYSAYLRNLMETSKWDEWVDVGRMVGRNEEYDQDKLDSKYKKFYSCWFELGNSSGSGKSGYAVEGGRMLRDSGFDRFPFLCGRWKVKKGSIYAVECPGMMAIGDVKTLQIGEKRGWQGVEKIVNPHWIVPSELASKDNAFIPGEKTYLDEKDGGAKIRPAHDVNPAFMSPLLEKQNQVRDRIYEAFFFNLFRTLELLDEREMTATEISARKEEKLVQLVPTLNQLNHSVLKPLIDYVFDAMMEMGGDYEWADGSLHMLPEPPEELQGMDLDIEYLGLLAQAQKATTIAPVERFMGFVAQLAEIQKAAPESLDKVNTDKAITKVGVALGVDAEILESDDEANAKRQARAKAQQVERNLMALKEGAGAARNLAASPMNEDNALVRLTEGLKRGA